MKAAITLLVPAGVSAGAALPGSASGSTKLPHFSTTAAMVPEPSLLTEGPWQPHSSTKNVPNFARSPFCAVVNKKKVCKRQRWSNWSRRLGAPGVSEGSKPLP